jgi:hypothetical protein
MENHVAIIVKGAQDATSLETGLNAIPGLTLKKEEVRGVVTGALKVAKWIAKLVGDTDKIADALIGEATKHAVGASIELQCGATVIKISNANRSEIIALLDKAAEIARR